MREQDADSVFFVPIQATDSNTNLQEDSVIESSNHPSISLPNISGAASKHE